MSLQTRARYAALKRHKRRQTNGLWCEPGCQFHRPPLTGRQIEDRSMGLWTWMYCNNLDQLVKEGLFDENREQILQAAKGVLWD